MENYLPLLKMLALQDYSATIGRLPLHIDIHGVGLAPLDLWVQVEPLEGVDSGGVLCEVVSQDALQSASEGRSHHQGLVVGVVQPLGKEHGGTGAGTTAGRVGRVGRWLTISVLKESSRSSGERWEKKRSFSNSV